MTPTLRPATAADFEPLFVLLRAALSPHQAWDDVTERARFAASFSPGDQPSDDNVVVARSDLAGIFGLRRSPQGLFLMHLALAPAFQGQGFGRFLLTHAIAEAEQKGVPLELTVALSNPARHFYTAAGLRPVIETDTKMRMRYSPGLTVFGNKTTLRPR